MNAVSNSESPTGAPRVSVIVPTRNRPEWLDRCLRAIQQQRYQDYEVIVVDDGSSAEVLEQYRRLIAGYGERFCLHLANSADGRRSGPSYIRNLGVSLARGEFISFCDDDDFWCAEDHLQVALTALQQQGADLYFANQQISRDDQVVANNSFRNVCAGLKPEQRLADLNVYAVSRRQMLHFPDYAHLNISMAKRSLFDAIGGFWEETRYAEDVDLFVRLCDRAQKILFRPDVCSTHNAPTAHNPDSASKIVPDLNRRLLESFVYEHLLAVVRSPEAMRYARLSLSSNCKVLTQELLRQGSSAGAVTAARLALAARPSLKWALYTLWLSIKAGRGS